MGSNWSTRGKPAVSGVFRDASVECRSRQAESLAAARRQFSPPPEIRHGRVGRLPILRGHQLATPVNQSTDGRHSIERLRCLRELSSQGETFLYESGVRHQSYKKIFVQKTFGRVCCGAQQYKNRQSFRAALRARRGRSILCWSRRSVVEPHRRSSS